MAVVTLSDSEAWLRSAVGTGVLLQGRRLSLEGVVDVKGASEFGQVHGRVTCDGETHTVEALVRVRPDGDIAGFEGWCSCGRAVPCPHAVALLLVGQRPSATGAPRLVDPAQAVQAPAARRDLAAAKAPADPAPAEPAALRRPAVWEGALAGALAEPPQPKGPTDAAGHPGYSWGLSHDAVALQFEVTSDPRASLLLRPAVKGASGGWVRTGISWSTLDYGDYYFRQLPPAHLRLLQELRALPSRLPRNYNDRALILDGVASRRVWDLLLEAQESGLPLVMAGRRAEPVRVHSDPAVARLEVTRERDQLAVLPRLEIIGRALEAYQLMGEPPHGVAWPDPGATGALELARLAAPPHQLFAQLQRAGSLHIPAADEQYFLDEYYPQLRHQIDLVCRDGSVELPAAQPPVLRLTVSRLAAHRVELGWQWEYTLGTSRRSQPLGVPPGQTSGRDLAAEARVLDAVTPVLADLPGLVELGATGPRPAPSAVLDGIATARFMSGTLPLLEAMPDVEVRLGLDAHALDYREVDAAPVIRFTADTTTDGMGAAAGPGQLDWFDLAVTVTVDGHEVPFERLFVALAQEQTHLVLDNGVYFSLDREEFAQLARLIAESRAMLDAPPATVRLNRFHAELWGDVERLGEITGDVESWRDAVRVLNTAADLPEHKVPAGLEASLRPYQETGFGWLATLFGLRLGGILADDMGLGKTLQALSLMLHVREQGLTDKPFLVIAPTSVVANWASEAARFAPGLTVATVTQTAARRGHDIATAIAGADLVVASYTLFRLEFDEYKAHQWAGLVLDEAQNVKNYQSTGYRCARELPADVKLAITGTPMENNLMELWSLLSITAPGLFPRADRFTEYYRTPIEREQNGERLAQLRRRVGPLLLRRTKGQVAADLPDRQEQVVELELNSRHRTIYARYLQRERQKVLGLLGDLQSHRFEIFRSLTLLRQASLDVSLVDAAHSAIPSTKLDALVEHLQDIVAEGHRVLVFSQFTRFLGHARDRLDSAGIKYCYLDGTTRNRPQVISSFRDGTAPVFLISLKAGGAGLNLTEADYVILLDPWWNPATEAQAVDRAHRIGQTRKVMVYRFVAKDTIEDKVMALKARKAALTSSVLDGGAFASGALTADDIRGLLG